MNTLRELVAREIAKAVWADGEPTPVCYSAGDAILRLIAEDRRALVEAYQEYVKLLGEELKDLVGLAAAHGWRSIRVEDGKAARAKIDAALAAAGEPPKEVG